MKRISIFLFSCLACLASFGRPSLVGRSQPSNGVRVEDVFSDFVARFDVQLGRVRVTGDQFLRESFRGRRQDAFSAAKTKLAVVTAGTKAGTGFIMREARRLWLVTNAHVVRGGAPVRAIMLDGTLLTLGPCEYAVGRDLARFPVEGDRPALELRPGLPDVGERVTVLGNSDGRGVITEINGRVLGVGPGEIEVDAMFTAGNSGSPVIGRDGRVIAVASYLRDCRDDRDWSKKNTRFNGIRRFALRMAGLKWERGR